MQLSVHNTFNSIRFICILDSWKCADDEKQCTSGQCFPASYFCDGKSDCSDHIDEMQCDSNYYYLFTKLYTVQCSEYHKTRAIIFVF